MGYEGHLPPVGRREATTETRTKLFFRFQSPQWEKEKHRKRLLYFSKERSRGLHHPNSRLPRSKKGTKTNGRRKMRKISETRGGKENSSFECVLMNGKRKPWGGGGKAFQRKKRPLPDDTSPVGLGEGKRGDRKNWGTSQEPEREPMSKLEHPKKRG